MTQFLTKNHVKRPISFTLLLIFVTQIIFPTASMALTGGPSQPEVQSFQSISSTDMVDVFSGDFKYNIPLMDVEGYPLNIAYTSGISTDQEASWVGLGWNLNVGAINRAMRGLPDDFKGETIHKELNMKPNRTFGINAGVGFEIFGKGGSGSAKAKKGKKFNLTPSVGVGLKYNNYNGFGVDLSVGVGISAGVGAKGKLDANLGLQSNAESGLDITPGLSFSNRTETAEANDETLTKVNSGSGQISGSFNTRAGIKDIKFSISYNESVEKNSSTLVSGPSTGPTLYNSIRAIDNGGNLDKITPNIQEVDEVTTISSKGMSAAGSVNFGLQSYVPSVSMPMTTNAVALNIKFGASFFGTDADITIGGSYSSQSLSQKTRDVASYGYMYSEYGNGNSQAMLDFNREKDASFSRTTRNLPITNFTYDVFNVTAQGMGGAFRPYRSDVGHVFDVAASSQSDSYSLGAEVGGGDLFKAGIDVSVIDVNSASGKWTSENNALNYFQFSQAVASSTYEPYYFKQVGEMSLNASSEALYNKLGGESAYGIEVQQGAANQPIPAYSNSPSMKAQQALESCLYDTSPLSLSGTPNKLGERQKRSQCFSMLTRAEAANFGLEPNLYSSTGVLNNAGSAPMKAYAGQPYHIAEITVLSPTGMRYYYGLPAYNSITQECSFNISGSPMDANGLVPYAAADASTKNTRGTDNYFSMTQTPAYAYSYLLTAIVSPDYVDLNNNGPDDADLGTYTKFHYSKPSGPDYKWRMPMDGGTNKANFTENSKSNVNDNMGTYSYGVKELWYLDEIETKNYLAKFNLSSRKDGFGVANQDGGINALTACNKLDSINLFAKKFYVAGVSVPIKTVHFVYNYDLCPGLSGLLPNNSGAPFTPGAELSNAGGKLTLKQIYFTYGKSSRAQFNKFQFNYAKNPGYHDKAYDRWGNYKPVINPTTANTIDYSVGGPRANPEFPYVDQDTALANTYARSWLLNQIKLPSGGQLNVNYESDDYAFVQNVPAGQMFNVLGMASSAGGTPGNLLYTSNGGAINDYLIVDISQPATSVPITTATQFINYYLKDINYGNKQLFFKFLVNLTAGTSIQGSPANYYEYVSGYADIALNAAGQPDAGIVSAGKAYIHLKDVSLKNGGTGPMTNPIAMSAIQLARLNYGNVVWGAPYSPPGDIESALKQIAQAAVGSARTMISGFKNPNKALWDKNFCQIFQVNKSIVRLYSPNGKKLGGGSRVHKIYLDDAWNGMTGTSTGQASSQYGQLYSYKDLNEYGDTISSGVASYEPMIGNEENSMKQPFYLGKNTWAPLAPDDRYYVEGPFGESFYPSPSVGYSKIRVSAVVPANATTAARTGYKQYEFYTAKDYPTITRQTPIMPKQFRSPLKTLVKIYSRDLISASQGYAVLTNDMHGKPKAEYDFAEGKPEAERESHFYYQTKGGSYVPPAQIGINKDASYSINELNNACSVINKTGAVATASLFGTDFDAVSDFRESATTTHMVSSQNNASAFLMAIIPALVPTIWPSVQFELSRFRSGVFTKVINQYGVLQKTVVRINKSSMSSENLAFDAESGDVLVSKTTNGFEDPVYTVKYPSYWGYDQMGGAYKDIGFSFQGNSPGNGNYTVGNIAAALSVGDELSLSITPTNTERVWVCSVSLPNMIGLIDQSGNPITVSSATFKVLRSGRRNLYNSDMSLLTCLNNPISTGSLVVSAGSQVLDAKAVSYSDQWQLHRGYATNIPQQNNCSCTITQTATDLINMLKTLFNTPSNADMPISSGGFPNVPGNAFFNGASAPFPLYTVLYLASGATAPTGGGTQAFTYVSTGLGISSGYPNYSNYNLNSNLLQFIPHGSGTSFNPGTSGTAPYVAWIGPAIYFDSFGSGNSFTGSLVTDQGGCSITFQFPGLTMSDHSTLMTYFNQLSGDMSAPPSSTVIDLVPASSQSYCDANQMTVSFVIKSGSTVLYQNNSVIISAPCFSGNLLSCPGGAPSNPGQCGLMENNKVNPYFQGVKGNWRSKTNYVYLTDRVQTTSSVANGSNTDIRKDGYYTNFTPLYTVSSGSDWLLVPPVTTSNDRWVYSTQTTRYNQSGTEIESQDVLGRYSSALYGYDESFPIAIASNARLQEIAFDGFEDYNYYPSVCNRDHHFDFYSYKLHRDSNLVHTGRYSLNVPVSSTYTEGRTVTNSLCTSLPASACYYYLSCTDLIYPFTPVSVNSGGTATDYVISYWVREAYSGSQPLDYVNNQITVTQGAGAAFAIKNTKKTALIDGWQHVEYTFTIPNNYSGGLNVNLVNSSATNAVNFDDIRLQPAASSMKTFVYNPVNLRYAAELDENNFATFYEYDEQGHLVHVKKETEKGIMTVKQTKTHYAN